MMTSSSIVCSTRMVSVQLVSVLYNGGFFFIFSRSSQCSTTGVTKAVVCVILSVG